MFHNHKIYQLVSFFPIVEKKLLNSRNIIGTTDARVACFSILLGYFPTNECEISDFCLQLENGLV